MMLIMRILLFMTTLVLLQREVAEALAEKQEQQANLPPRSWNSYDSFSWIISEEEFLQNAEIVSQRLLTHGYQYVVVAYLWCRKNVPGAYTNSLGFDVIDEWGRMIPDPERWPSSKGGKRFSEVAKKVHAMGLKFGVHVMRGISTQAVNANTPILDTIKGGAYEESGQNWRATDIGLKERTCAWMSQGFMSVDTKLGAVKNDCVFGDDLNLDEIRVVSEVLEELSRPILYSLSPGTSVTPTMAKDDVAAHFNVTRDFSAAKMVGAKGLKGKSWPHLDMLPLGWLTDPGSNEGPHRNSALTLDEQRAQMTLWSMAKSPLMFGGDLRKLDKTTYDLITEPTLLKINSFSTINVQYPYITSRNEPDMVLTRKSINVKEERTLDNHVMGLTSCKDDKTNGWVIESPDQEFDRVCWKYNTCSNEEMVYGQQYKGRAHLLATDKENLCLEASPSRKLTSQETQSSSFSTCKWNANQMWELSVNGSLVNSYSGLCATPKKVKANVDSRGIRSWAAKGRRGEIYLSFFNLTPEKMDHFCKHIKTGYTILSS
ncbi:hypothetical protein MKX01_040221 [Papaver californicum]|nr:hypothetical protein MKX01_040221 [Papaver californicum]